MIELIVEGVRAWWTLATGPHFVAGLVAGGMLGCTAQMVGVWCWRAFRRWQVRRSYRAMAWRAMGYHPGCAGRPFLWTERGHRLVRHADVGEEDAFERARRLAG